MFAFGEIQNSGQGYRYFWEDMIDDIYVRLKSCDICQRANDTKFSNFDAALHPILSSVESKCGTR